MLGKIVKFLERGTFRDIQNLLTRQPFQLQG